MTFAVAIVSLLVGFAVGYIYGATAVRDHIFGARR